VEHHRHVIGFGESDEASPVDRCGEMVALARPDGAPIALTVYPGVHHNFDVDTPLEDLPHLYLFALSLLRRHSQQLEGLHLQRLGQAADNLRLAEKPPFPSFDS
jgi:hypothetical protein